MGVELTVRARTNAYRHLSNLTQLQREERYDALKTSIREKGFLEGKPIIVLLNDYSTVFKGSKTWWSFFSVAHSNAHVSYVYRVAHACQPVVLNMS